MTTTAPIVYRWHEGAMHPLGRFARQAHTQFKPEQTYFLGDVDERSEVSHRHEFVWLKEAWATLPEELGPKYPSPEHLRKSALIATGWCTINDYPCANRAEAQRTAILARNLTDEYAVVLIEDAVVRVIQAKSQARGKMKGPDFQKSKTDILEWVAALLNVPPASLDDGTGGGPSHLLNEGRENRRPNKSSSVERGREVAPTAG